jgi:hypothetical protein
MNRALDLNPDKQAAKLQQENQGENCETQL